MTRAWVLGCAMIVAGGLPWPVAAAPRLLYPPENLVVSGGGVLHVLVDSEGARHPNLSVRVNGRPVSGGPATDGPVLHATVALAPGLSFVDIAVTADGAAAAVFRRAVFYASPVHVRTDPPSGFQRQPFHRDGQDSACRGCHVTTPGPADMGPGDPRQSTCFSCHARLTRSPEVHGPAAQWACTRCHDPTAQPSRYATPDPVMPLCFSCHTEQRERFVGNRYQHGPTATGRCTLCHNPHATEHRFFLKKAAWELCTTCHSEKASGRHVIAWGPQGQTHPTRGRPDPSRPGREVSCASCHNPHAAPSPKLWNFQATFYLDLCRHCHGNVFGG